MNDDYFLAGDIEKDRLQLQALVWESEAKEMLNQIGVGTGWSCVDFGCGAMGILGVLARIVGIQGRVVGIDFDELQLDAAGKYLEQEDLNFVELRQSDVNDSGYLSDTFDLVHSRFLLPHVNSHEAVLNEMIRITKPGGTIAIEESDHSSWKFLPVCPEWNRLLKVCEETFALKNKLDMGSDIFSLLRNAGLKNVRVRAAVKALQDSHSYMGMILTGVEAIRERAVYSGITSNNEMDHLVHSVKQCIADPNRIQITFTLIQVWGQKQSGNQT